MPRVSCVECQGPVVVDPQGLCPEGHYVGTTGARVEQAMGSSAPHPDEPQPWVFTILPERLEGDAVEPNGNHRAPAATGQPREARPVQAPGMIATDAGEDPAADSLLRELHSLSALDDLADERQRSDEGPPPPPVAETDPAPEPAPRPSPPPRPDSDSIADAFAELSALDSSEEPASAPPPVPNVRPAPSPSVGTSGGPSPTPPSPAATDEPIDTDHTAENDFASLFGDPVEPPPQPPTHDERADGGANAEAAAPASVPESHRGALRVVPNSPPTPPGQEEPSANRDPSPVPAAPALDLTSFTAKGGAIGRNGRGKGRRSRR